MLDAIDRIARFFDQEFAGYEEDLPVLEAYAARTGGPVLELGCGTGRVLIHLARAGYRVTGVDMSLAMLEIARAKAEAAGLLNRVTLIAGDYGEVALGGPYHFACTVMNTFLHLPDQAAQVRALQHWRAHLAPDGLLLIDVLHPDPTTLAGLDGRLEFWGAWRDPASGHTIMKFLVRTVDLAQQTLHVRHIYDELAADGQVRRTQASYDLRYVGRFEAELLLEKAGYLLEGIYGDWEMGPFTSDSPRLILVARRRG
ncbi:MAG: class I SAM-dependent methyltransferase [Anaerolineae bacterium]